MDSNLVKSKILEYGTEKYKEKIFPVDYIHRGILNSEAFAICTLCDLYDIDVLIESGVAYGRSTEIFGKYGITVNSIDRVDLRAYSKEKNERIWNEVKDRLSVYPSITLIKGDSFKIIPKLLKEHKDKRIGLFIDGPKDHTAMRLATNVFNKDIKFIAVHDQKACNNLMARHFRDTIFTNEEWYDDVIHELDKQDIESLNENGNDFPMDFRGFGLGIYVNDE